MLDKNSKNKLRILGGVFRQKCGLLENVILQSSPCDLSIPVWIRGGQSW